MANGDDEPDVVRDLYGDVAVLRQRVDKLEAAIEEIRSTMKRQAADLAQEKMKPARLR